MSGLLGWVFDAAPATTREHLRELGSKLGGVNHHVQVHVEEQFGVVVSGRGNRTRRSLALLHRDHDCVLAFEGYVVNLPELVGGDPAAAPDHAGACLLNLFLGSGRDGLLRLNGAFHLVIWEAARRRCTIHACKFGQRTTMIGGQRPGAIFASEARAIAALSGRPLELAAGTVAACMFHGGVPGTRTPFRGVRKLLPGTTLVLEDGRETEARLPDLPHGIRRRGADRLRDYLDELHLGMKRSMRRLTGIGGSAAVMMGSGVDSSLVAAYARRGSAEIGTLTQAMPGDWNEAGRARDVATHLNLRHEQVPYRPADEDLPEVLGRFVEIVEEPAYWNQLGAPILSFVREARPLADVFFSGAEADLLFNFRLKRRRSPIDLVRYGALGATLHHSTRRLINAFTRHTFIVGADFDLLDRSRLREHLDAAAVSSAADPGLLPPEYPHLSPGLNAQRHLLDNGWQNVRIIDSVAKSEGAEALLPYLDDDVAAFLLSIPDELRVNKFLLRRLLRRHLPARLVPKIKRGYWGDTVRWFRDAGKLAPALDLLSEQRTLERGLYDRGALRSLIDRYRVAGASSVDDPILWQLLVFEIFCRRLL